MIQQSTVVVHFSIFFQGIIDIAGISNKARPLVTHTDYGHPMRMRISLIYAFIGAHSPWLHSLWFKIKICIEKSCCMRSIKLTKPAKDLLASKIWVKCAFLYKIWNENHVNRVKNLFAS